MDAMVEKYKVIMMTEVYAKDPEEAYAKACDVVEDCRGAGVVFACVAGNSDPECDRWKVILDGEIVLTN